VLATDTTQGIETRLRSARRMEFGAALGAAYLAGGLTTAAVVVSYELTPLPVALDLARAGVVLLLALAVIAGLIRRAVVVTLRGQRELHRDLEVLAELVSSNSGGMDPATISALRRVDARIRR
jgi:hypothetical protein